MKHNRIARKFLLRILVPRQPRPAGSLQQTADVVGSAMRPLDLRVLSLTGALSLGLGLTSPTLEAQTLGPLAQPPDWSQLQAYTGSLTREEFVHQLRDVYAIDEADRLTLRVGPDEVAIRGSSENDWVALPFREASQERIPVKRYWRTRAKILGASSKRRRPLEGLRVVLDPGHLGGRWARMEERWFHLGDPRKPVTEGDMTLEVARLLKPRLEASGARVWLTRDDTRPVTKKRPRHFVAEAGEDLERMGITNAAGKTYLPNAPPEDRWRTLQWHAEKAFIGSAKSVPVPASSTSAFAPTWRCVSISMPKPGAIPNRLNSSQTIIFTS